MRKFFLIAAILLSATAAHAGANLTVADADVQPTAPSSAQLPDASVLAAKRQDMIQQQMAMRKQKQMAMQREMRSPDTHAPSFFASQVQTKVAPRDLMCRDSLVRSTLKSRLGKISVRCPLWS